MNDISLLPLTNGGMCIVDSDLMAELMKYKWLRGSTGHVYSHNCRWEGAKLACIHRFINMTPNGLDTDHKNRIPFDNRRHNLRSATPSQNGANKAKKPDCSSQYIGVRFRKSRNKWEAGIRISGKKKFLGRFIMEIDAASAYNKAAFAEYGEFAVLNKIHKEPFAVAGEQKGIL